MQLDFSYILSALLLVSLTTCATILWRLSLAMRGMSGKLTSVHNSVEGSRVDMREVKTRIEALQARDHELDKRVALLERTAKIDRRDRS